MLDRLQGFAEDVKQGDFTDVVLLGMGGSSLGPEVLGETFGRQSGRAALPHARQHRSRADQGDRAGDRSQQDAVHCLLQIREHAGTQHFHGLFPRPRRRGARKGKSRRALRRRNRSGSSLERRAEELRLRPYLPWRAFDRRALLGAVEVRSGAGCGDGSRRRALLETTQTMERACGADVPPSEKPGCATRRRHGRRGNSVRPRQGDDHCFARDRRSRCVAGAASGGKYRQAETRAHTVSR